VKLYDKTYTPKGCVLRAEATIHNADDFRVYRRKEGDRNGPRAWRRLRRGIADLYRRAQLSHKAAARYLHAFATVDDATTLDQLRAHALITKIVGTHRYQLTSSGRRIIVAILSALRSTVAQLTPVTAQLTAVAA